MRLTLGLLVVGSLALVACGGDDGGGMKIGPSTPPAATTDPNAAGAAMPASSPAATACSSSAVKSLSADKDATDLHIVAGAAVYRDGANIIKIDAATAARSILYTSPDLVHSFADASFIVTVEAPDAPDAVLMVMPITGADPTDPKGGGAITVTPTTPWNAGGTTVFASDETSFYVLADVTDQGDTIFRLDKSNPNSMTMLAQLDAPLSDPQLVGTDVWFVRDQKRVYQVKQTPADPGDGKVPGADASLDADPATEIFGIGYADCKLAVGRLHAFCSTGKSVEQRDLAGANLITVFDAMKQPSSGGVGDGLVGDDTLYVRSLPASASDVTKNGIRSITTAGTAATDKMVVCGRDTITAVAVDKTTIVWAEDGKGVFTTPR